MWDLIDQFGYLGLFLITFLSASLLPLVSEVVVVGLPALGFDIWLVLIVATAGNFAGSLFNYYLGRTGRNLLDKSFLGADRDKMERAEVLFRRWGAPVLFFSWLPVVGDPLTVVAGALHLGLGRFSFWVLTGKLLRYAVLLGLVSLLLGFAQNGVVGLVGCLVGVAQAPPSQQAAASRQKPWPTPGSTRPGSGSPAPKCRRP